MNRNTLIKIILTIGILSIIIVTIVTIIEPSLWSVAWSDLK